MGKCLVVSLVNIAFQKLSYKVKNRESHFVGAAQVAPEPVTDVALYILVLRQPMTPELPLSESLTV